MSCLLDRAWCKVRNNTVYTGVCVCGKQMGAKVTLTRIINHCRFDGFVKRPDVSKCSYTRGQLLKDFPGIALRNEHFAKKEVQHPAAGQAAPATAVQMVAAAAAASGRGYPPSRG